MSSINVNGIRSVMPNTLSCRTKLKTNGLKGRIASSQKVLLRKNLQSTNSSLQPLAGPYEKEEAEAWLAAYVLGNAGLAALTAQAPGIDEAALSAVEVGMAAHILRGIYKFKIGDTAIRSLLAGCTGAYVGTKTFKLASKAITWVPIIGNGLNAIVSGTTTAALGASIIAMAEKMDAARRRGEKMDEFIRKMEEENKKGKKP